MRFNPLVGFELDSPNHRQLDIGDSVLINESQLLASTSLYVGFSGTIVKIDYEGEKIPLYHVNFTGNSEGLAWFFPSEIES